MILGYIDPGQGMLIWQAIVSAFVGFLFYLKKTRDFILGLFFALFRSKKAVPPAPPAAVNVSSPKLSTVQIEEVEVR